MFEITPQQQRKAPIPKKGVACTVVFGGRASAKIGSVVLAVGLLIGVLAPEVHATALREEHHGAARQARAANDESRNRRIENDPRRAAMPKVTGPFVVQIAALRERGAASQLWLDLQERSPGINWEVAGYVEQLDRNGAAPLYRLRAGSFPDAAAASAYCSIVEEAGEDCIVVPHRPVE